MELSIVIPAYRAEKMLEKNIGRICGKVEQMTKDFEILVVTGKSPDRTLEVAKKIAAKNTHVKVIQSKERLGKGKALTIGFSKASGKIAIYTDADLEIGPKYIPEIAQKIRQGCDIAIASKYNPGSRFRAPALRQFLGKGYNALVRLILGGSIRDYQGGLKGFKKEAIKKILPHVKDEWWFWDTEALMVGQWLGFTVCEVPIAGSYGFGESTVKPFSDCFGLFQSILSLKKRRLGELSKLGT